MALTTRRLGRTDMEITRVGLGAFALGGGEWAMAWGDQADDDSIATMRYAVEQGVNWIDTAPAYGLGHAEEVVRRAFEGFSDADRPLVFTKAGLVWDPENPMQRAARIGAAASLKKEVEDSLRRLGVERIDLYQMHWPPNDGTPVEDYWATFAELKASGKVRAIGLSNHSGVQLDAAEGVAHVDTLQPPFSAINTGFATDGTLDWCVAHDTGVIVYSPMGSGLLTGAMTAERVAGLPENDWRRRAEAFTDRLDENLAYGAALGEVATRHGVPQSAAAVAWTLGFAGVTAAIVGARTPAQVDGWIDAANTVLDAEDYAAVGSAIPKA